MIAAYATHGGNIIAVGAVPDDQVKITASSASAKAMAGFPHPGMVEKPEPGTRRPTSSSRPLHPAAGDFRAALRAEPGAGGEIQITDAMLSLLEREPFHGLKYKGRTFDCGSKIGFLTANVAYALDRQDIAEAFAAELEEAVLQLCNATRRPCLFWG